MKPLLIATFMSCIGANATAQVYDTPPPAAPPRQVQIAAPIEQTLPNGLRVVVAQREGLPLITAVLLVRAGAETDPQQQSGLADMTSNMLTKGTRARSAPQIAQAAEALGSSITASAGWHAATLTMTVTSPRLSAALALMSDLALNPVFAETEIERYRKQTIDSLRVAYSRPGTVASLTAQRALFGAGAYGHPAGGTPDALARITRSDLVRQHHASYRPDNAVLILAGDISPEAAFDIARKQYAGWHSTAATKSLAPAVEGPELAAQAILVDMPDAGQAGVVVALPSIKRSAPDYYPGRVASAVLGDGYSSRLNEEIRVKRGLSYGARASFEARRAGGVMLLSSQTKNPSAFEVAQLMTGELQRMAAAAPATAELEARKASLIGSFSRSLETTAGLAGRVASLVTDDIPLSEIQHTIDQIQNVSADQVRNFAQSSWQTPKLRVVVAGDAKKIGDELSKTYPTLLVVPIGSLDVDSLSLAKSSAAKKP